MFHLFPQWMSVGPVKQSKPARSGFIGVLPSIWSDSLKSRLPCLFKTFSVYRWTYTFYSSKIPLWCWTGCVLCRGVRSGDRRSGTSGWSAGGCSPLAPSSPSSEKSSNYVNTQCLPEVITYFSTQQLHLICLLKNLHHLSLPIVPLLLISLQHRTTAGSTQQGQFSSVVTSLEFYVQYRQESQFNRVVVASAAHLSWQSF